MEAFQSSNSVRSEAQRLASGIGVPEGVNIATFHTGADERSPIGRTTTARETLIEGASKAATEMSRLLNDDPTAVVKMFESFRKRD